jgi:two-component system sensor kinase FixL
MHLGVSEIKVGEKHLFTGIVRDISEQKLAEEQLAAANEQLEDRVKQRTSELRAAQSDLVRSEKFATLGKVSGGIAHEIRNPLNAVKTSAYYLLNARNPSDEKTQEHLERIDRQVSLIDNVVTALSDVAKLPEANLSSTNIEPILQSALNSVSLPDEVEVEMSFANDLPKVMVDANQIVIVFKNLIRNARDAMAEGGKLTLAANVDEQFVTVAFSDTGSGISEENLTKIMEPLFTTKATGMGLGLSISRAIVEKNKGQLSVESEFEVGSTFSIAIQRSDD